jgi:central kinetochore subunit Mis15/CHL4
MAPSRAKPKLSIPSTKPLPHSLRLPSSHPALFKTLSKLSRPALLELATEWCLPENRSTCAPYINEDDLDQPDHLALPYTAATTYGELTELYRDELSSRRGSKRELLDRILEGDWRHGISLHQLAMAETRSLLDHPNSQRWSAFVLARHQGSAKVSPAAKTPLPRIHLPTFLLALHNEISALTRAHYYFTRPASHPITLVRISLFDTPYTGSPSASAPELAAESKSLFVAFPDGTPFAYISLGNQAARDVNSESRSIQAFVLKSIPVALSKPHERYELQSTSLTTRSLDALLAMRGAGMGNAAGGGWSIFADEKSNTSALDFVKTQTKADDDKENTRPETNSEKATTKKGRKRAFEHANPSSHLTASKQKRQKENVGGRFGVSGKADDGKAISRFDVRIEGSFPEPLESIVDNQDDPPWKPNVKLSFQGSHVFAGIRKLAEIGVIEAAKMPGWLTGETNVSVGTVRDGRIDGWDVATA